MKEWNNYDSERDECTDECTLLYNSHHKASCAMEARFLKEKLSELLGGEVFLDSDDLRSKLIHSALSYRHCSSAC